jgi:kynureninase
VSETVFQTGPEFAAAMDARDALAPFRERFCFPATSDAQDCIYLCGHSLGLQPKSAGRYIEQELQEWAKRGVEGHFHGQNPWMPYHRLVGQQTAALTGAEPSEVVVMNSLTTNLHLMMASFYRPTVERHKILIESCAFPSDQYAVKSQIRFHGFDPAVSLLECCPRAGEPCLRDDDIASLIERAGSQIAMILLGGVNYATGQLFNMPEIVKLGRRMGCVVGFDLAHAIGNVPLQLHDWDPDFAVWCSYKYLNGGPGCVAGCFVHERHARAFELPRFAGWWGHDEQTRFRMGAEFRPMAGAEGWQLSNPPILALAPLRASMEIFSEAGMERLRAKSVTLTGYMEFLLKHVASPAFSILTPPGSNHRGAQLSIRIAQNGRSLCDRLVAEGVIGDWREPDTYRVAAVPLYNSYRDVFRFVQRFASLLS